MDKDLEKHFEKCGELFQDRKTETCVYDCYGDLVKIIEGLSGETLYMAGCCCVDLDECSCELWDYKVPVKDFSFNFYSNCICEFAFDSTKNLSSYWKMYKKFKMVRFFTLISDELNDDDVLQFILVSGKNKKEGNGKNKKQKDQKP